MYGGAAELSIATGAQSKLEIVGTYLQFDELAKLSPPIRRQNTLLAACSRTTTRSSTSSAASARAGACR